VPFVGNPCLPACFSISSIDTGSVEAQEALAQRVLDQLHAIDQMIETAKPKVEG
jgi:hypothetical protein